MTENFPREDGDPRGPLPPPTAAAGSPPADASSPGEVVSTITHQFSTLVRQEVELAAAELSRSASRAGKGAGMVGGAGVAGLFALLFLSLALWWALGMLVGDEGALPGLGWSGLIVAALWGVVAAVLALSGRKEITEVEGLPRTAQTVRDIPGALRGEER